MTTTNNQGADTARETGMSEQTQVVWTESYGAGGVHGIAHVGGGTARTLRQMRGTRDGSVPAVYWSAEATEYDDTASVRIDGRCPTLDEARAKAVEQARWVAEARRRAIGPDLAAAIRQAMASVEEARAAVERGEGGDPAGVAAGALAQLAGLVGMRACVDCGAMRDPDDLSDGVCEACAYADVECEGCGGRFDEGELRIVDGDELCGGCADEREADDYCSTCSGTGIGQHGDPDTSMCHSCGGGGVRRAETDPYEAADRAWERAREGW